MIPPISYRNTLPDAWNRTVQVRPNKIALQFLERTWTFHQLHLAGRRVAMYFLDLGLEPGDRIATYGKNSDAYLISYLACLEGGFIHVPVNYGLVDNELAYILSQSGSKALFYDLALADKVASVCSVLPLCDQVKIRGSLYDGEGLDILKVALEKSDAGLPARSIQANECVQIMYTSGTTSLPKGAIMTHECLLAEYMSCIIHLRISESNTALAAMPLYHTAQMHVYTVPTLLIGGTTILINTPDPATVFGLIEAKNIDSFFAPPTVWINLLRSKDLGEHDLSTLQNIYYGASIMPEPIIHELMETFPQAGLYNCYGQTEISPLATVLSPEDHKVKPASAGRPVLNVEIRIVDDDMKDVPVGERGELVHRSPQLMRGYWDKDEETEKSFTDGWFHSGDLGIMDEDGYIYIVDRIKDVINTGGVLVASREVEEALYQHSSVTEVAVIGTPNEKWIEAISAFVVIKDSQVIEEKELINFVKKSLAPYKIPKHVHFMKALPKNASGKILKRELRDHAG